MNKEIYEKLAAAFASQLRDVLSSMTYDKYDEFMDVLEEMMVNTADDKAEAKMKNLLMTVYEARIEEDVDIEGISLDNLSLNDHQKKIDDYSDDTDITDISMDDFIFSL